MILALFLAAAAGPVPAQQGTNSVLEQAMDAHARVARAERELEFFERYALESEAARARARVVLERLRPPGSASGGPSSARAVSRAIRALGTPSAAADPQALRARERLEELVDALDLQPTPGMFAAGTPIEGAILRAFVSPLFPPPERLPVTLSLLWIRSDGSELLAYRGLAKAASFDVAGFSVDLAFPGNEPGIWRLAIEVEREGVTARGPTFEVQCVEGLAERTRKLFGEIERPTDPRQAVASWIALESQRGLRTLTRVRAEEQLARLEGDAGRGQPYPWSLAFASQQGAAEWIWRLDPSSRPLGTLLLLAPSTEPAEASLTRGEWRSLEQWRVLSTHLPPGAPGEGTTRELFERLVASLALRGEEGPIVCVARGDSVGRLSMDFHGASSRPYAAEILSMSLAPASAQSLAGALPRWVFAPGGSSTLADSRLDPRTWWLDAPTNPLIADFELPARLKATLPLVLEILLGQSKEEK